MLFVFELDIEVHVIHRCFEVLPELYFTQDEFQDMDLLDAHFGYIKIDNALEHIPHLDA